MIIAQSICLFCLADKNCGFKRSDNVTRFSCDDYQDNEVIKQIEQENNKSSQSKNKTGLCITCDNYDTCGWHNDDTVIFQCEHYQ